MTEGQQDELLRALGTLGGATPEAARDARVRARCHATMALGRALGRAPGGGRPRPARSKSAGLVDTALALGAASYGVFVIAEALRIGWRPLG